MFVEEKVLCRGIFEGTGILYHASYEAKGPLLSYESISKTPNVALIRHKYLVLLF